MSKYFGEKNCLAYFNFGFNVGSTHNLCMSKIVWVYQENILTVLTRGGFEKLFSRLIKRCKNPIRSCYICKLTVSQKEFFIDILQEILVKTEENLVK